MSHHHKIQSFCLAATLSMSLSYVSPAFAQDSWKVTPLGSLGGGSATASGINDAGQVVGYSYVNGSNNPHAFITGPNGLGMRALGISGEIRSRAIAINSAGQVVGSFTTVEAQTRHGLFQNDHAFITGPNGSGIRDIGASVDGTFAVFNPDIASTATGINDAGQVIGVYYNPLENFSPFPINCNCPSFITGPNGVGMTSPGSRGLDFAYPADINHAGRIVAGPFITGPNGQGLTRLAAPDPSSFEGGGIFSRAINDAGQVVGNLSDGRTSHAFITGPDGFGVRDLLGNLGGDFSVASDINSAGQVVGTLQVADALGNTFDHHAFVTGPNAKGIIDLGSLIQLPGGRYPEEAVGINNVGQVIVNDGVNAYLLTAVPEPDSYALMFAGLGLVGFMVWHKNRKVL